MIPKKEDLEKAIKEAKKSKKRNFVQSVELIINLKDLDLKRPENRISEQVALPHGPGKKVKLTLIGGGELARKAKGKVDLIISKQELELLAKDKKKVKNLAKKYDFFLAQPELMSEIASKLGQILGPLDKIPEVVPPNANLDKIVERLRKSIRIKAKKQPIIQCLIGTEQMGDKELAENALEIFKKLRERIQPRQVKRTMIKLSMGKVVRV